MYATREELIEIAVRYCNLKGYKFLFVSEDETRFGFEYGNGSFLTMSFMDLAYELGY